MQREGEGDVSVGKEYGETTAEASSERGDDCVIVLVTEEVVCRQDLGENESEETLAISVAALVVTVGGEIVLRGGEEGKAIRPLAPPSFKKR